MAKAYNVNADAYIKAIIIRDYFMNAQISFTEEAVDNIDYVTDKFRTQLCRRATQLALSEGLSVVTQRQISEANNDLVASDKPRKEKQEIPDPSEYVKPDYLSTPSEKINQPIMDDKIDHRDHNRDLVETITLQETWE